MSRGKDKRAETNPKGRMASRGKVACKGENPFANAKAIGTCSILPCLLRERLIGTEQNRKIVNGIQLRLLDLIGVLWPTESLLGWQSA
jgi:hypothetical protein